MKNLFITVTVLILFTFPFSKAQTKLYGIYTSSHEVLLTDWFLPTLLDDYEINMVKHEQECPSGTFYEKGWNKITLRKVELWLQAIEDNWGDVFIASDVDIQFFGPTEETLLKLIKNKDLVIQRECPDNVVCTGFFICRANEKTKALFTDVCNGMRKGEFLCDQTAVQKLLIDSRNPYKISWSFLPSTFFGAGTLTGKMWNPGDSLPIPRGILLHHANWTKGVPNKIKQLEYVRKEVGLLERYRSVIEDKILEFVGMLLRFRSGLSSDLEELLEDIS